MKTFADVKWTAGDVRSLSDRPVQHSRRDMTPVAESANTGLYWLTHGAISEEQRTCYCATRRNAWQVCPYCGRRGDGF